MRQRIMRQRIMRQQILAIIFLVSTVQGVTIPDGFNQDTCIPAATNGGKDFPKIPNQYVSRLEWTDHVARRSTYMQEYVSVTNNIGVIYVTGLRIPGRTSKFITSASTGELFTILDVDKMEFEDGNCIVSKLSDNQEFALPITPDPKFPGTDRLMSGRSLLDVGANIVGKMLYNGTAMWNGIPCDVWIGCLYSPSNRLTITATYYFSVSNWQPAGGASPSIVAIRASGAATGDHPFKLEQTFNYGYFSTQFPSQTARFLEKVFETPEHNYCAGRIDTYRLPDIPIHFSFRAEVVDHLASTIMFTREVYDFQSNFTRIDFKTPPTGNDTVDAHAHPKTVVNDFGTGLTYLLDKGTGECVTMPITTSEFDAVPLGEGKTRMRTPSEFFNFDSLGKYPYQYMGEHNVRDIAANGWIAYRPYPHLSSSLNATWEWYFSKATTIIKAQDVAEINEPLRLDIKSSEASVDISYNVYRFSEKTPDPRYFDIRTCFRDAGSHLISLQLTGNWSIFEAEDNLQLLRYWFQLSIDDFTGLRAIRVQDIEFEFFDKNFEVTFTLLGQEKVKGDIDDPVQPVALQLATDRLIEAVNDGIFQVYYMPNPRFVTIFYPVKGSLRVIERNNSTRSYRPSKSALVQKYENSPGITTGAAIGLAFGVLFLGILLTLAAVLFYNKITNTAPKYVPHHNDE
ncbi:uncharacterized protein [Watersipora subatra]|uniref:uncharacterized protein n=1 Tax=Watersipora subatra TaxID=2589382 RepID=UPI00355C4594